MVSIVLLNVPPVTNVLVSEPAKANIFNKLVPPDMIFPATDVLPDIFKLPVLVKPVRVEIFVLNI